MSINCNNSCEKKRTCTNCLRQTIQQFRLCFGSRRKRLSQYCWRYPICVHGNTICYDMTREKGEKYSFHYVYDHKDRIAENSYSFSNTIFIFQNIMGNQNSAISEILWHQQYQFFFFLPCSNFLNQCTYLASKVTRIGSSETSGEMSSNTPDGKNRILYERNGRTLSSVEPKNFSDDLNSRFFCRDSNRSRSNHSISRL